MPAYTSVTVPDFTAVLRTGDLAHAVRASCGRGSRRLRAPRVIGRTRRLRQDEDELTGSIETYYCTGRPTECAYTVLPATDSRLQWRWVGSTAVPVVSRASVTTARSTVVKVARRKGRSPETMVLHPAEWAAVQAGGRVPPHDVVAALQRMDLPARRVELEALRNGEPICVYIE